MSSFSFDDVDLSAYDVYILKKPVRSTLPAARDRFVEIPGKHGGYYFGGMYDAKRFNVECVVKCLSRAALLTRLDEIAVLLDTRKGFKKLVFDDQPDRYLMAKVVDRIDSRLNGGIATLSLSFVAADAFAYGISEINDTRTVDETPETVTITPGGTAPIEPVITLTISGVCSNISIEHLEMGQTLTINESFVATDIVLIDTSLWLVKINGVVAMNNVSGMFITLKPSFNNSIKFLNTLCTAKFTYRNRYL